MDGWHVRCWRRLRDVENAGEALPYLKKSIYLFHNMLTNFGKSL